MKTLLIIVSFLVIAVPTFGQSERPESIVIPVSGVGDVTDTRKTILQNSLEENLKEHFKLVPQEVFKKAQEKAFEELEYDECNEDQCIMLIQEMLQVENVFHLQIIVILALVIMVQIVRPTKLVTWNQMSPLKLKKKVKMNRLTQ